MKTCTKCKIEKPFTEFGKHYTCLDGLRRECKECRRVQSAEYKLKNKEKVSAAGSDYYAKNKEKINTRISNYRLKNKDIRSEQSAKYREKNKEKIALQKADYYRANKEKIRARNAEYKSKNPEKFSVYLRNRRARVKEAEGSHTAADVRAIFERQRGLCASCGAKLLKSGAGKYHVDHIMPIAKGGTNWPENLQCLCPTCNRSKSAKLPDEWAAHRGMLI
jgi:5-methylcytosine-specific restriction endonuclease McrA